MGRLYCRIRKKVAPASRPPGVGRTLLSDALDLDFWPAKLIRRGKLGNDQNQTNARPTSKASDRSVRPAHLRAGGYMADL